MAKRLKTSSLVCFIIASVMMSMHDADAAIETTTVFGPPTAFGLITDGRLFSDSPYPMRKITEVRIVWDIQVDEGFDAGQVDASVLLPIQFNSDFNPFPITPVISMRGSQEGWSGSGNFSYRQTIGGKSLSFGAIGVGYSTQALGLPGNAVEVLPTSRIEIDYINNIPGDTDDDGDIDDADLGTSFANYTGAVGSNAQKTFLDGDTDGDGDVDDADLGTSFASYTGALTPTAVPEPVSACVLLAVLPVVGRRRHR